MLTCNKLFPQKRHHFDLTQYFPKGSKQALVKNKVYVYKNFQHHIYFCYLFYLYIYPPDSQESDGGANT